jgi:hypothetical protein
MEMKVKDLTVGEMKSLISDTIKEKSLRYRVIFTQKALKDRLLFLQHFWCFFHHLTTVRTLTLY